MRMLGFDPGLDGPPLALLGLPQPGKNINLNINAITGIYIYDCMYAAQLLSVLRIYRAEGCRGGGPPRSPLCLPQGEPAAQGPHHPPTPSPIYYITVLSGQYSASRFLSLLGRKTIAVTAGLALQGIEAQQETSEKVR